MLRDNALYILLGGGIAGLIILPVIVDNLLRRIKMVRPNYRDTEIPVGFGLFPLIWSEPLIIAVGILDRDHSSLLFSFALLIGGLGLLGFIDDRWGDRSATGLRGHLKKFIDGEITTGFVKAVGGLTLSICVCKYGLDQSWKSSLVSGLIIALSANMLNLLDLRPGRASGTFLLVSMLLLATMWSRHQFITPLMILAVPVIILHERDCRARAMMGDCGSNSLGAALGISSVLLFPGWVAHALMLLVLVGLHLLAEKISFTKVIAGNPILSKLDRMLGVR